MQTETISPASSHHNVYQTTSQDFATVSTNNHYNMQDTQSEFMNGVSIAQVKPIAQKGQYQPSKPPRHCSNYADSEVAATLTTNKKADK